MNRPTYKRLQVKCANCCLRPPKKDSRFCIFCEALYAETGPMEPYDPDDNANAVAHTSRLGE